MLQLNYLQLYVVLLLGACTTATSKLSSSSENIDDVSGSYRWVKLTEEADFHKSYNFQMIALRDTLWVLHPDGNWYSLEGKDWLKSPLSNSINNLAFLDYVLLGESLYGLGHFEGNSETYKLTGKVFKTDDMNSWEVMPGPVNLPERFFYHPFVFKGKLWIIGGNDGRRSYADAWSSTNGTQWKKEADDLPFGNRDGQQFVLFKDRIFMLANDVWSSEDGVNWKLETKEILPGEELFGYSPVVFDGKIWLLGCNRNGKFSSQVLVSDDGINWTGETAPWSPRGGIASTVFNGKVYMTGGKYGGMDTSHPEFEYGNDVWMLEKVR